MKSINKSESYQRLFQMHLTSQLGWSCAFAYQALPLFSWKFKNLEVTWGQGQHAAAFAQCFTSLVSALGLLSTLQVDFQLDVNNNRNCNVCKLQATKLHVDRLQQRQNVTLFVPCTSRHVIHKPHLSLCACTLSEVCLGVLCY